MDIIRSLCVQRSLAGEAASTTLRKRPTHGTVAFDPAALGRVVAAGQTCIEISH